LERERSRSLKKWLRPPLAPRDLFSGNTAYSGWFEWYVIVETVQHLLTPVSFNLGPQLPWGSFAFF